MQPEMIARLNAINRKFYEITATDFDATRGRAWPGWAPLTPYLGAPLSVLDVGCGNGRFGVFLAESLSGQIMYHGIDNNAALLAYAQQALTPYDHVETTVTEQDAIMAPLPPIQADLVTAFGVLHHVPGYDNRQVFVKMLAECVAQGGMLALAAWRFYEYDRFRDRLVAWDESFTVEKHDYLLDWRRGERALRYCHYVDDAELQTLIAASGLDLLEQYRADGSDNRMNQYIILRKS